MKKLSIVIVSLLGLLLCLEGHAIQARGLQLAQYTWAESNPGAEIWELPFSDGMHLTMAAYKNGSGSPIVIFGGYGSNMGLYHFLAQDLNQNGVPVVIVNMPGEGRGHTRSNFFDQRGHEVDPHQMPAYPFTVEGMATMYMQPLGEALQKFFNGRKLIALAQSRSGYGLRVFASGYRAYYYRNGQYYIRQTDENIKRMNQTFQSLTYMFSPHVANEHLVEAAISLNQNQRLLIDLERERPFAEQRGRAQGESALTGVMGSWILGPVVGAMSTMSAMQSGSRAMRAMQELERTSRIEFILSDEPMPPGALEALRLDPVIAQMVGTDQEIQKRLELVRYNIGPTVASRRHIDPHRAQHMLAHGGTDVYLPQGAHDEFVRMNAKGGWQSQAVTQDGQTVKLQSSYVRQAKKGKTPELIVINSSTDLSKKESEFEFRLNPDKNHNLFIKGVGHGFGFEDQRHKSKILNLLISRSFGVDPKDKCFGGLRIGD